jgi:hypothetical protein
MIGAIDAHALWYFDGSQVSSGAYAEMTGLSAASDGAGGMVVVWSTNEHVYAKRYDSTGAIVSGWSLVTVGDVEDTPSEAPRIIFNGTYWYVAWIDPHMVAGGGGTSIPGYIVRVAKLKSTGSVFHSANVFSAATSDAEYLTMATRTGGGVTLGWEDNDDGRIQYFRTDLNTGPSLNLSIVYPTESFPLRLVPDNSNGSIAVYIGGAVGKATGVDSTATSGWATQTMLSDVTVTAVNDFSAISDGSGGAVMAFDVYETSYHRVWLQHVTVSAGTATPQWTYGGSPGTPLCISSCSTAEGTRLVLNSAGTDAILTWIGTGTSVYAQKLPLSGAFSRTVWGAGGKLVTSNNTGYDVPTPVANANGYTTIVWNSAYASTYYGVHYQILEDDGDLVMGAEGTATADRPQLQLGPIVAGNNLQSFGTWAVYDGDDTDLRAARLTPFWSVAYEFVEEHCRNNVSWETVASGTTNRMDYRRIGVSNWTTKTPAGSSGSYSSFFPQYLPSEFKLRTTISSVEYESLVYTDEGSCGEPDPQGAPMAPGGAVVKNAYLNARPNPFNPVVTIGYGVPDNVHIELAVFDVSGKRVKTLVSGVKPSGEYSETWIGVDERGDNVASGIYFARLTVGSHTLTQKLVMLK